MATNNLNPTGTHLPVNHPTPTPAPSGMSVLAKLVIGIAALFFTAFLYVAFSGSGKPSTMPPVRKEDQLAERQRQEIERITLALQEYFGKTPPTYSEQFGRIYEKFTGECKITAHDIEAANLLLQQLASPASADSSVRVDTSVETDEQRRDLIKQQDQDYKKALDADQLKRVLRERETTMTEALTPLNAEITEATEALGVRLEALRPLQECWRTVSTHAFYDIKLGPEETYATAFKSFEERLGVTESLDCSMPEDCYHEAVTRFNVLFPDEEESFVQKRATLAKGYQAYTATLEQVFERLAWVRLRAYHDKVGEAFFAEHFSKELLGKICRGEEVPLPQ